ncbi:MAG: hypothetical protein MJ189_05815 [Coriobacteriales bacterium]|nr:hypothetical protein [Coriobacteriales bacterium]
MNKKRVLIISIVAIVLCIGIIVILCVSMKACYVEPTHEPDTNALSQESLEKKREETPLPSQGDNALGAFNNDHFSRIAQDPPVFMVFSSWADDKSIPNYSFTLESNEDKAQCIKYLESLSIGQEVEFENLNQNIKSHLFASWDDGGFDMNLYGDCAMIISGDGTDHYYKINNWQPFYNWCISRATDVGY